MSGTRSNLFAYIKAEVTRGYQLDYEEERFQARRDKVYTFFLIPRELERLMAYGFFQCADAFLFLFTYLPLRVTFSLFSYLSAFLNRNFFKRNDVPMSYKPAERCDLLKLGIFLCCVYLFTYIDTSVWYHNVKSQPVIKLYILYNMLEIGDRLCASFVQDTIDALFLTATEEQTSGSYKDYGNTILCCHILLTILSVLGHAMIILLQGTTLSVAINSSNSALLVVMMSNNFVELKGAVFKKFDKINLFQVSCSDVRERFHLSVLLLVVCLQTMREYGWAESRFWVLLPDCLTVLVAEVIIDWLKHAFITRFNEIQPEVYREYTVSLAYDLAQTKQRRAFSDHSDMVGRRLGFVPLPLAVVLARILRPVLNHGDLGSLFLIFFGFFAVASFRTLNSIILLGKACDLIDAHVLLTGGGATTSPCQNVATNNTVAQSQPTLVENEPVAMVTNKVIKVENEEKKNKFARSYSASHTPRPSIGSINELKISSNPDYHDDTKLLPANSTVSILSVNFNEEMIAIATNVKEEQQGEESLKLKRKHSLGSNLVDSENLMGGGGGSSGCQDVSPEGEYFYDDEFCLHGDLEVAKGELGNVEGEEEEESDSFEKVKVSAEVIKQGEELKQGEESVKRVKKKSISGWFKDLGGSGS